MSDIKGKYNEFLKKYQFLSIFDLDGKLLEF